MTRCEKCPETTPGSDLFKVMGVTGCCLLLESALISVVDPTVASSHEPSIVPPLENVGATESRIKLESRTVVN